MKPRDRIRAGSKRGNLPKPRNRIKAKFGAKRRRKRSKEAAAEQEELERRIRRKAGSLRLIPIESGKLRSRSVMGSFSVTTLAGRYYLDFNFRCRDCGKREVWTGSQQKWWFEEAGGEMEQIAVRCRSCRRKERERKAEARRIHFEGLARKKD